MLKQMFSGEMSKTYATRENAVKAFAKACGDLDPVINYVVCVTESGRFFCVFLPTVDQVQLGISLGYRHGIATARV